MHELVNWRKSFLARRGLELPNGDMLFAYRTSMEEYQSLKVVLGNKLGQVDSSSRSLIWSVECALFVLYAAEWWRREYTGGAWRWGQVLASIPSSVPINIPAIERAKIVELGLN